MKTRDLLIFLAGLATGAIAVEAVHKYIDYKESKEVIDIIEVPVKSDDTENTDYEKDNTDVSENVETEAEAEVATSNDTSFLSRAEYDKIRERKRIVDYTSYASMVDTELNDQLLSIDNDEQYDKERANLPEDELEKPFVIHPESYGKSPNWEIETLELYPVSDDIKLTDEINDKNYKLLNFDSKDLTKDMDYYIGMKNLQEMGGYEEDMLYVRHPKEMTEYEIVLMDRPYEEDIIEDDYDDYEEEE